MTRGQWRLPKAFHAWRRGAGGLPALVAAVGSVFSDKRRAYRVDAAH